MTENGVAYVWLRDDTTDENGNCGCGCSNPNCGCQNKHCNGNCCADKGCGENHKYILLDSTKAGCTTLGYDRYLCMECGKIEKRDYVDSLGHAWQSIVIRDATCETDGKLLELCARCGQMKQTATPKGEKPTLEKQIQNNNDGQWSTTGNVAFQLGDTVKFRIITSVPDVSRYPDGYTYIVHDTMTVGFTSKVTADKASVSIVIDNDPADTLAGDYYTIVLNPHDGTGETSHFDISIDISKAITDGKLQPGDKLYINYEAVLNEKADIYQIGRYPNTNTAQLEYSNNPNGAGTGKTPESKVNAWTFPAIISKVDGKDNAKTLEGAKFVLSRNPNLKVSDMKCNENGDPTVLTDLIPLFAPGDQQTSTAAYDIATAEQIANNQEHITYVIELGSKTLAGFGEHAYYLYETKAPNGYNLLSEPVKFTFHSSATNDFLAGDPAWITLNDSAIKLTGMQFEIANNSGATLPETGGIGTTLFYVIGALLVVGAGVLLVTKKRMGKADN